VILAVAEHWSYCISLTTLAAATLNRKELAKKAYTQTRKHAPDMLLSFVKFILIICTSTTTSLNVPAVIARAQAERFTGGLLGVSADVSLCIKTQHASIELSGIPLGGTLKGTARFHSGEGSSVLVDEPLDSALKRRFVKIIGARFDRSEDRVYVTVKLPLLLGTQTIALYRASGVAKPVC
jgi:hypothetical protein